MSNEQQPDQVSFPHRDPTDIQSPVSSLTRLVVVRPQACNCGCSTLLAAAHLETCRSLRAV